ncbi:MAG: T9SS type A sorting domain-containing protein [Candidatus Cloacimonetes bacterium]|nr:T9SS type A sorting domain-containing protein [Candidatus Cloacimonadota bacterium]
MFIRSKPVFLTILLFVFISCNYAVFQAIEFENRESITEVLSSDQSGVSLYYQFDRLNFFTVATDQGNFTEIFINELAHTNVIGEPKLPMSRRFIAVPLGAEVLVRTVNYQVSEYQLSDYGIEYPIIPVQHPVPKCPDAEPIPFEYNSETYSRATYFDHPLVLVEEIGIMRGVRLFAVELYPVDYAPQAGTLKVYNDIEVKVNYVGSDFAATEELRQRTYSPYFEFLYQEQIMNFEPIAERQNLTRYPVKYIIITHSMFTDALEPFIEWKLMKGFETIVGVIGSPEVGSTTTSIKNYIQGIWDAATPEDPAPSFVLFVGDTAQIPAYNGQTGSHITDLHYVRLEGTDFLPEMFYGRFSANNLNELQPQIDKTLVYEKLLIPDPSYLGEAVLIAGVDSWWATSHGNGHINYGTEHYFNASNGILAHAYLYPASGSSSQAIINNVSNGVGYANYTAHGSPTSWSDPSFTINNIYSLQNENKYPFVVGNCCITNKFDVYECFGEAWLRAPNKGAIGYVGGTDNTYWNEDFWWGVGHIANIPNHGNALPYASTGPGMFDGLFHTHGEDFVNWYTTGGAMIYAGNMAVEQSNSTMKNYYWEIYSLMGDPSLTPYMREPLENIAIFPQQIFLGQSQIQISATPYSYVGVSMDSELHGAGLINASGQMTLEITPFTTPGIAHIVITLQNHAPIIAEVQVIPNEGPYVIMSDFEIDVVGSTNNTPQFGDTVNLHITLENVGVESATGVAAQLSTEDTYITIVDGYELIGDIDAETALVFEDAFQLQIANNIPDQHRVFFIISITDNEEVWTTNFNIVVNAPDLVIEYPTINDPAPGGNNNGLLDPGETATLVFPISNNGNAMSPDTIIRFTSGSPYLTLLSDEFVNIGFIGVGMTLQAEFNIAVDSSLPIGTSITTGVNLFSDAYAAQETIVLPIGLLIEDFETGDFSSYPWQFSGNANWFIDTSQSYSGSYSARSGTITHNQSTSLSVTMNSPAAGEISFYLRVSSEANYDFLRFFINNQQQGEWSGNVVWQQVSFPVQAGNNTFRWTYIKDYSVSSGSDCAWIDYIIFPAAGTASSGPIFAAYPLELDFGGVPVGLSDSKQITISNFGDEQLTGTIISYEGFIIEDYTLRSIDGKILEKDNDLRIDNQRENHLNRDNDRSAIKQRMEYDYSVPTESYLTLQLLFVPEEEIDYSGQINITSNDPLHQEMLIDVMAYGTSALLSPINLQATIQGNLVMLSWESLIQPGSRERAEDLRLDLLGFNVYRDDQIINQELILDTSYEDTLSSPGSYLYYVTAVYDEGESEPSNIVQVDLLSADEDTILPFVTKLNQNYPNPFNPDTTIEFTLNVRQPVKIAIYNISGQLVRVVVDEVLDAGIHQVVWNGMGNANKPLASGIYLYRMSTDNYVETRKMILLK